MGKIKNKFEPEMVEIEHLYKAPWNYKEEDDFMSQKLIGNIRENGILQVSIVYESEDGVLTILDGNHRLDAYRKLGIDQVPCMLLGKIPLARAKRIAIEVNDTRFANDRMKLAQIVDELKLEFDPDDLDMTLPFDDEELGEMERLLSGDGLEPGTRNVNFGAKEKIVKCPKCNHDFKV